ncbi:MAG: molybdate ABC transporter permease subunit [Phycisphaeraceae bacterium]|nr:molybdate ABC transporter permease subunit [Phycisphaeraceae bacterium]
MTELLHPLFLSLEIALSATVLAAIFAVPLAYVLSRRRFPGRSVVEAIVTVPLVLPPTVVGYLIIMTLGSRGWIGRWLHDALGYSILFRFEGAVLAAALVALPMLYLPAKAGFAGVNRDLEDIARLLGSTRWQLFWRVSLPLAGRGIGSGVVLAFARALGEFGATMMVFGLQADRTTLPIVIYLDYEQGQMQKATLAVIALSAASLVFVSVYNRSGLGMQTRTT